MAEALGRTPAASRYSADMSKHAYLGTDPSLKAAYQEYAQRL
jgi:betaine-homocysteine S-methyltransferase